MKAVLNFMKKLYCLDRVVPEKPLTPAGFPLELYQAISSIIISFALLHQDGQSFKHVCQLLYVIMTAVAESSVPLLQFVGILKHTLARYDPCPKRIPNGKVIIISQTIYFIADKLDEIIQKSD